MLLKNILNFKNLDSHQKNNLKKQIFFRLVLLLIIITIIVGSIEMLSVVYIKRLGWNYEPAYLRILKGYTSSNLLGGRTEYHSWGSWNVPKYTGRIANNCFDVSYSFNSYGARDKERSKSGKNRTLVFGDSFTEGWGVPQDKILTAQLEKKSKNEYLNFGVAGSGTGPLNEYVLYRDMASTFEHDTVIVDMYLGNDFRDNDPAVWSGLVKVYYRPFWELTEDKKDIEIKYFSKKVKGKFLPGLEPENRDSYFKVFGSFKEFSAFFNLTEIIKSNRQLMNKQNVSEFAYDLKKPNVSDDSIVATTIIFDKFAQLIGEDKKKYIVMIPAATDVLYYQKTGKKMPKKFLDFKKSFELQGWTIIDTLQAFGDIPEDEIPNYFICDGHWNANGNELAAEYILKTVEKKSKN